MFILNWSNDNITGQREDHRSVLFQQKNFRPFSFNFFPSPIHPNASPYCRYCAFCATVSRRCCMFHYRLSLSSDVYFTTNTTTTSSAHHHLYFALDLALLSTASPALSKTDLVQPLPRA